MKRMFSHIPAILLGLCFLVSGGLKGIDPYGTSLKLGEYFRVWGWDGFVADHALVWAVCLCGGELCIGLWLLLGVFRRLSAWLSVAVMAVFTAVTGWLAFTPAGWSVTDCGCFGEAFTLGHGATFAKNVVLLALSVCAAWAARKAAWLPAGLSGKWTALCCVVFGLAVPAYSALRLPPADFLPYNRGTDLAAEGILALFDRNYEEVTDSLLRLSAGKPLVAVVFRRRLTEEEEVKLSYFRDEARRGGLTLCRWTLPGMAPDNCPDVFYTDGVTLKSLLRAESGIVVVEDGIVRAKRNLRGFRVERFGRSVTADEMMRRDGWLLWRYAAWLLAGLAVIVVVHRREKGRPR